ncbi:MAG: CarD family transcriptional regulator [Defluviitaleaceae bacterium]|nr:CarD family transcriptional regulator [Defluviitaleaceae bacterium]
MGDKVVYPMHGAGIIEELEHLEIDGSSQMYYVMMIPTGNLKIRVAAQKAEGIGIREIYSKDEVLDRVSSVQGVPSNMPENWNQRYKENLEKIKTGNLDEVALVFRNLLHRERERGLSSVEKKMLQTAKQIILSEIVLSQNLEKAQAEQLLVNIVQ